jgi:hypothetical protein
MKKLIHNLRQKPLHVRRMIAFVTSITLTALIGLILVSNLIAIGTNAQVETIEEKTPSPFALMYEHMKDFFKSTGNQMAEVSTIFSSLQSSTTVEEHSTKNTVATSSDGSIGVSTTSYNNSETDVDTLPIIQE